MSNRKIRIVYILTTIIFPWTFNRYFCLLQFTTSIKIIGPTIIHNEFNRADRKKCSPTDEKPTPLVRPLKITNYTPDITKRHPLCNRNGNHAKIIYFHNFEYVQFKDIHSVEPWPGYREFNRYEEVVLDRLRTGHGGFSHGHHMEKTEPPLRPTCNNTINSHLANDRPLNRVHRGQKWILHARQTIQSNWTRCQKHTFPP